MRKILSFLTAAAALLAVSCVDLSPLEERISALENRMDSVEEQLRTLNTNANGLKRAVENLEKNVFVKEVRQDADGYTIVFSDNTTAVIKNGNDGKSPIIGVKDQNGVIVWTVNGEPILDANGKPVPVTSTPEPPQFKFEGDTWYYKVGDGDWIACGTGSASGSGCDCSIEVTENFVIISIGGNSIALPLEAVVDPNEPRLIDKSKMAALSFPDDSPIHPDLHTGAAAVFDGLWPPTGQYLWDYSPTYLTVVGVTFPVLFGIDMGEEYKISKLTWYPRHIFCCGHPRVFEVYGATVLDTTKPLYGEGGALDPNWTKLATFESFRPSGLTTTAIKDTYQVIDGRNENEVMFYGQDFTFPTDVPTVRYLRFRILEIWGDDTDPAGIHNTYVECNEISLYAVLK